jgi:PilZ domain
MKRHNRKRKSQTAKAGKVSVDAEKAPSPSSALAKHRIDPGEEFIPPVEVKTPRIGATASAGAAEYVIDLADWLIAEVAAEKPAGLSVTVAEAGHRIQRDNEVTAAVETDKSAALSSAAGGADRRNHPRYKFIAAGEVVAAESGARIATRVRDLSQQGCYVDTDNALPLGTATDVRITKGAQLFEARARVVYSRASQGMGLMFTAIDSQQLRILETWLTESRETSWLAANRRRSQRVLMTVPVRVAGQAGAGQHFEEETQTVAISAHGALILVSTQVYRGQRLTVSNLQTKAALECVVAHIEKSQGSPSQVGVEFLLPNPIFWHVAFPPKDWTPRHPHAKKSHARTGESS